MRSAGWATWSPADAGPASGVWVLGSEFTSLGGTFGKLHQCMSEIHMLGAIDAVFYEMPLNLGPGAGITNQRTIDVLHGLAMHAESWADAMECRMIRAVNQSSWRRHFLGGIKRPRDPRTGKQIKVDLKGLAMERCGEFGWKPAKHDQAEALGILDYAADAVGFTPPWRHAVPLVKQFESQA